MQVLNTGTTYRIYDASMRAFDQLPAGVYKISFDPRSGYSLILTEPIAVTEKVYGKHTVKVDKVYKSFKAFPRNLGVILSGAKGIGKSLFAKMLSIKAVENGYPILICDYPYPGIADFIGSIQQEIVVLFDEFDKTFASKDDCDPQTDMLTLFDGLYSGKKLFIVTCNEVNKLNDYLVNRPGRFHYHFRFDYPDGTEIREYLCDNVNKNYWESIEEVVSFATKVNLNYDCLRAIAFELNMGSSFSEAAEDLNIVNVEHTYFDIMIYFKNGTIYKRNECQFDIFSDEEQGYYITDADKSKGKSPSIYVYFTPSDNVYDYNRGNIIIDGKFLKLRMEYDSPENWSSEEEYKTMKEQYDSLVENIDFMLIKRRMSENKNVHYCV